MIPTEDHKLEWSRLAHSAYACGLNDLGHRFSGSAAIPRNVPMAVTVFDALQDIYRAWLVFDAFPADAVGTAGSTLGR